MRELAKKPAPGGTGSIYSGRCAGGSFRGTQVLMIAADDDALAAAWEELQKVTLVTEMVYDVSVISQKKLDALLPQPATAELLSLDVE